VTTLHDRYRAVAAAETRPVVNDSVPVMGNIKQSRFNLIAILELHLRFDS